MSGDALNGTPRADRTRDCLDPWTTVFVQASGDVALCCWSGAVGNVRERELALIVDGEAARRMRAGLLSGRLDAACANCPARGTTTTMVLNTRVREYLEHERERREFVVHARSLSEERARLRQRVSELERDLGQGGVGLWRRNTGPLKAWWARHKRRASAKRVDLLRACIESLEVRDDGWSLSGWAFALDLEPSGFELAVDGRRIGELERVARPDVALAYPAVPSAERSGFRGTFRVPAGTAARVFSVVAMRDGEPAARADIDIGSGERDGATTPPAHLMDRVAHIVAPELFRLDGVRAATEVLRALGRHRDLARGSLLDWGTGCGRVSRVLRQRMPGWTLSGVDVDAEAIEWLRQQKLDLELAVIAPDPPTRLAAERFDVVLGLSVMTHLDRARQLAWLAEIARVAAPGATVLLSVHGPYAARMVGLDDVLAALDREGISDHTVDATLRGVESADRYRATFQTEDWTRAQWRCGLEIVEWIPGGLGGFQDLIVLRKPGVGGNDR